MSLDKLPVGAIIPWAIDAIPTGWLLCNGAAFSGVTYPELAVLFPSLTVPNTSDYYPRFGSTVGASATESTRVAGRAIITVSIAASTSLPLLTGSVVSSAAGGHGHSPIAPTPNSSNAGGILYHSETITPGQELYHQVRDEFVSSRSIRAPADSPFGFSHTHTPATISLTTSTHGAGHSITVTEGATLDQHSHTFDLPVDASISTPTQSVEANHMKMHFIIKATPT